MKACKTQPFYVLQNKKPQENVLTFKFFSKEERMPLQKTRQNLLGYCYYYIIMLQGQLMQEFGPYKQQERTRTFQQKLIFQDSPHYAVFTSTTFFEHHLFSIQTLRLDTRSSHTTKNYFSREFGKNFIHVVAAGIMCIKF